MGSRLDSKVDLTQYRSDYVNKINEYRIGDGNLHQYRIDNPMLENDAEGNDTSRLIDYVGGSDDGWWGKNGHGLSDDSRGQILSAMATAEGTINSSVIEANAMLMSSAMEADAAITAAIVDAEGRIKESDNALEGIKAQAEVDLEIAKMERDVEMEKLEVEREKLEVEKYRIDNVDSVNASANVRAADAEHVEAEGEKARDEGRAARYKYSSNDSLWSEYTNIG
ncbi:hypothetical protein BVY03_04030 [bacterium K02(2017)]|nr:hypothetical protein BVY03_04030 [bacterium K02(2017)]